MPVLKDIRTIKEIILPSFPDSKVVIYDSILVGDLWAMDKQDPLYIFVKLIKEWNFTDDKGAAMPVNIENLKLLSASDLNFMAEQTKEFQQLAKKA